MAGLFKKILSRESTSAYTARERMKLVLIHDRTNLTPGMLERLKDELIGVLSRYVDIDPEEVRIDIAQAGREQRLVADIPIKTNRKR